ncbi:MAG: DUF87 domain-containing protein [Euryarchaeota archaeon]|nr:DUF87 domain-containing protein [Euryarchaeota archaeon]
MSLFMDTTKQVVVSVLGDEGGASVVQAFKKLATTAVDVKELDPVRLDAVLSGHSVSLELFRTAPTQAMAERGLPPARVEGDYLVHALKKVDAELARERADYKEWRGVRDVDVAQDHLRNRREEIFGLEKDIIKRAGESNFLIGHHYLTQPFQATERFRLGELRDQAKERASALKSRIEFTRRNRINELEDKRRELVAELDAEKKQDKAREKEVATRLEAGLGVALLFTIRSTPIFVVGRKNPSVREAIAQVARESAELARKLAAIGLEVAEADPYFGLSTIFAADPTRIRGVQHPLAASLANALEATFSLTSRESFDNALEKFLNKTFASAGNAPLPDLVRFPTLEADKSRRLAYMGLAMGADLGPSRIPVFYDLDEQGPRHTTVIGGSGSGKSVTASLIVEGALLNRIPVLVMDPTRSWTGFLVPASTFAIKKYEQFSMKPEMARPFELEVRDSWNTTIEKVMERRSLTILSSPNMTDEQEAGLIARILNEILEKMKTWPDSKELRLLVALEEAHRYLREKNLQPTLELVARTARAKGVGLMAVSQNAIDLPPAIRNNCATVIQMNTHYGEDLKRAGQTFGSDFQKTIPRLQQGQGAYHYPEYGSAFVAFRPPLHNHHPASEPVLQFYAVTKELEKTVGGLFAMEAVPDVLVADVPDTERTDVPEADKTTSPTQNHANTAQDAERTTDTDIVPADVRRDPDEAPDWKEVASTVATDTMTAGQLVAILNKRDIRAPTTRTLRRFLHAFRQPGRKRLPNGPTPT